jgi:hypothetical protein
LKAPFDLQGLQVGFGIIGFGGVMYEDIRENDRHGIVIGRRKDTGFSVMKWFLDS